MPFTLIWHDRALQILTLKIDTSLEPADLDTLVRELAPLSHATTPVYCHVDLSEGDVMTAFDAVLRHLDRLLPEDLGYHLQHSRMAFTGGPAVRRLLSLSTALLGELETLKEFPNAGSALSWLQAEAASARINPSPPPPAPAESR